MRPNTYDLCLTDLYLTDCWAGAYHLSQPTHPPWGGGYMHVMWGGRYIMCLNTHPVRRRIHAWHVRRRIHAWHVRRRIHHVSQHTPCEEEDTCMACEEENLRRRIHHVSPPTHTSLSLTQHTPTRLPMIFFLIFFLISWLLGQERIIYIIFV